MSSVPHLPCSSAADAALASLPLSPGQPAPFSAHAREARLSFTMALLGSTAAAAVVLTGLLTAILQAPSLPAF